MEAHDGSQPKAYFNPYKLFVGSFIPEWLERRKEISPGAKLCYARLLRHADRETGIAWPKQETLGEELGVSSRMIRDYLGELGEQGLIESRRLGLKKSNRYRFLLHPWITSALERKDSSGQDRQDSSTPLKSEKNQELKESNPRTGPEETDGFQSFESFWTEYPKKVKRKDALDAWMRIRPTAELCAKIIAAVKQQRASPQWRREDGRYIPDPEKWLMASRWEDEVVAQGEQPLSLQDIRRRVAERQQRS